MSIAADGLTANLEAEESAGEIKMIKATHSSHKYFGVFMVSWEQYQISMAERHTTSNSL
jgi:hypothetical protein